MTDPALDEALTILQNERRRQIVYEFAEADQPLYVQQLIIRLASRRNGVEQDDVTRAQINRERAAFTQHHHDKLMDAGVLQIERNGRFTSYGPGPNFDAYFDVLAFARDRL